MSSVHRFIVLATILGLTGCIGLTPPSKYDISDGLVVEGEATGRSSLEPGTPAATREARMAAILQGLAVWCETFVDVKRDVDRSEDEIPLELYDPEAPPEDVSNLTPYKDEMYDAALRLGVQVQPTGRSDSSPDARRGLVVSCNLRPGVEYRYQAEWDEFEVQILDVATLAIVEGSDYYQPMTLVVAGGALGEPEADVVPLEYVEGLLGGHGIEVGLQDLSDGAARATLVRRFGPPN